MATGSWDFLIAGAGPAGSRAAELLARRGLRTVLFDPKAPWEKPCGGGLTAAAVAHTPELLELESQGEQIRELLITAPSGASARVPLRRPYLAVGRLVLSRWGLRRATAAGVQFVSAGVSRAERVGQGWRVRDSMGDVHHCQWLIGADGAASRVRGVVAPTLRPELAPARVGYPPEGVPSGRAVFRFLPQADGYLWDFPRGDHRSVGVGVAPGSFNREAMDGALAQYRMAEGGSAEDGALRGAVIPTWAWESGTIGDLGGRDYALIGDAAGLADPATGEGIDYALRSAALAAEAFQPASGFTRYPARLRAALGAEMQRALVIRRWLYHPGIAERLVRWAGRSPRGTLVLMTLADTINEHGELGAALWRCLVGRVPDLEAARGVCGCDTGGASAPSHEGYPYPRARAGARTG